LDDELVVDADLAEFVFNDGDPAPVLLGQDAIEERRFAGAQEAGEHRDGNAVVGRHVRRRRAEIRGQRAKGQKGNKEHRTGRKGEPGTAVAPTSPGDHRCSFQSPAFCSS
jgi:hypothetical protein